MFYEFTTHSFFLRKGNTGVNFNFEVPRRVTSSCLRARFAIAFGTELLWLVCSELGPGCPDMAWEDVDFVIMVVESKSR